jgi:hypothetical protein
MKIAQGETLGTHPPTNPPPRRGGMKQHHPPPGNSRLFEQIPTSLRPYGAKQHPTYQPHPQTNRGSYSTRCFFKNAKNSA